jgi:hypothetical protein
MIFDDINEDHGMTRTHQSRTDGAANGARAPDQDRAMIHGVTDGVFFGVARHCNLPVPRRLPQSAIPCKAQGKVAG